MPRTISLLAHLDGARNGNRAALEHFLVAATPAIERFLRRRVREAGDSPALLEDLVHDALLRIIAGVRTCRAEDDAACWAWVLRVAWRAALDAMRAPSADAALLRNAILDDPATENAAAFREWNALASTRSPDDPHALLCRFAVESQRALAEPTRRLLWLRLVGGETWTEIGKALGIPPAAAKRRFQRAQRRLRRGVVARIDELDAPSKDRLLQALCEYSPTSHKHRP